MFDFSNTKIARVDLSICLENLENFNGDISHANRIKRYSTEHLLVLFYADTEKNEEILDKSYKQRGVDKTWMRRKKGCLMDPLKRTDADFGAGWEEMINNNVIDKNILWQYRNFKQSRNKIAHPRKEVDIVVTWEDVKKAHEVGKKVMEAIDKYLMNNLLLK